MQPLAGLWVCDGCPGSPPTPPPGPGVPVPPQLVTPGDSACPLPCRALEAARCWGGCCGAPQQAPSEPCPQGHQLVSEGTNPGDRGWPEHHGLAGGCPEGSLQVLGLRWGHTEPPALLGHHAGTSSRTHGHHGHPPPPPQGTPALGLPSPWPPAPGTRPYRSHQLQGLLTMATGSKDTSSRPPCLGCTRFGGLQPRCTPRHWDFGACQHRGRDAGS